MKSVILVVEDHPHIRAAVVEMLQSLGHDVHDAFRGEDALKLLAEHPEITVLFADVRMPGMDGLELAEQARRLRPSLKIVLTSGYIDAKHAARSADAFVVKPYRLGNLAAIFGREQKHS